MKPNPGNLANLTRLEKRGFTFIELIIAVTIFSVIAVSIYSVFSAGLRIWKRTSPIIEANQAARFFFDIISKDLKDAVAYYKDPQKVNFEYKSEPKSISFWTLVDVTGENNTINTELAKVTYSLEPEPVKAGAKNTDTKVIVRNIATRLEGFKEIPEKSEQLLSGVKESDFGFEFCYKQTGASAAEYEYDWGDKWEYKDDKSRMPRGVRVKLGSLVKTVFIPTGDVLVEES